MSVLIHGMEMPTSCRACMFSRTDIRNVDWCVLTEKDLPCDCPLIPVPDHGQLLKVLKTERECVSRDCDRNCGKCDLSLEQSEILTVYDTLVSMFSDPADKEGEE